MVRRTRPVAKGHYTPFVATVCVQHKIRTKNQLASVSSVKAKATLLEEEFVAIRNRKPWP